MPLFPKNQILHRAPYLLPSNFVKRNIIPTRQYNLDPLLKNWVYMGMNYFIVCNRLNVLSKNKKIVTFYTEIVLHRK